MIKRILAGTFAILGLGVGATALVVNLIPARPFSEPLDPTDAENLWTRCKAGTFALGAPATNAHPGLDLYFRLGVHSTSFGDYFNSPPTLVGMIDNRNTGVKDDDIGKKWKTMPPGTTCIFMGGEGTGLFARAVWVSPVTGKPKAVKRRVSATFSDDAGSVHNTDGASWDEPVDIEAMVRTASAMPEKIRVDFDRTGFLSFLRVTDEAGAWFTCSEFTCCKAK